MTTAAAPGTRTIKISDAKLNKVIDDAIENADFINDALHNMAEKVIADWFKQTKGEVEQRLMQAIAAKMPKIIGELIKSASENVYLDY